MSEKCVSYLVPGLLKRQKVLDYFYSQVSISITCFGLRPGHMVSDLQLTEKITSHKSTTFQLSFALATFTLSHKVNLSSTKLGKVYVWKSLYERDHQFMRRFTRRGCHEKKNCSTISRGSGCKFWPKTVAGTLPEHPEKVAFLNERGRKKVKEWC